jgi:hypothetical protein
VVTDTWHVVRVTFTSTRWQRFTWWLPSKHWRQDGWRWRVATAVNKLPGQCWSDLVEWALRRHEDDPDTPFNDAVRRVPFRRQTQGCRDDRDRPGCGSCYCGQLMTPEFRAEFDAANARWKAAQR